MNRDEQLARLVDEAQTLAAEKGHVDVDAFVESLPTDQAADLGEELRELLDTVQMLRKSGGRGVAAPSRPLQRVAHYKIERELGRGGMGVVYLAWDEHLERWVALKVLPGIAAADAAQRERFERESKAVARLVHPNIIPLYGAGESDGCLFLAMQYVEGDTLEQHVAKRGDRAIRNGTDSLQPGATTFRQLARIMRDVALGVDHAHRSRILHRDLKLANVILDPDGKPWVLDFGVCRFTEAESGTQTGSVLGTLRSMAPEQIDGKADERSDVYGLGLMLYELLTAQAPYEATHSSALIRSIQSDEPRRPRRVDRRIPADLETIARKAYAKLPGERYASADAFAQDLDAFAEGRPITARAPGALYLARLFATRHKAIVAVLLLALAVIGAVGLRSVLEIQRQRDNALYDAYDARMAGADAALSRGEVRRALLQLDQAPPDHAGWEWKHLRVRADQTLARWRPLAGQSAPLEHIRFEPGGDRFAVGYLTALAVYGPGAASTGEPGGTNAEGPTQASLDSYDVEWKSDVRALKSLEWLPHGEGWAVGNWPDAIASVHHGDDALGTFKERYAERLIRLGGEPTFTCPDEGLGMFTSTTKGTLHRWSPDDPAFETIQVGAVPLIWCGTGGLGESLGGLIRDTRPRAWALSELGTFTGLDPRTGAAEHVVELGEGTGRVHLLHMDLEHESAILGDAAGAIRRVDLRTGRTVQRFRSVGGEVEVGALTSDGRRLISGGHHNEVLNVHDTETGKLLGALSGHSSFIASLEPTPSGEIILTGDAEGTLAAWNPAFSPASRTSPGTPTTSGPSRSTATGAASPPADETD